MYRKSLTVLLATGMVLSTGTVFAQPNGAPNAQSSTAFDNKVIKKISADNMYNTIALLSEQPRAAGTEGEVRAVKYIESQFKSLGFETKIQPFPIYDTVQTVKVKIGDSDLGGTPRAFSGSISGKVTAELVHVGKAKPEEIGDNVSGKIALIERGDINFVDKVQNVLNKGAVGVLMYNNSPSGNNFGQVSAGQNIPAVAITQAQGVELVEQLKSKPITTTLEVGKVERIEKTSYNVIASLKPKPNKDNGQIITVGAHHDSVPGGPGAN
ncbi:MAG: PA domain-containing protein, partial [Peribacillus sp.]